MRRFLLLLLFFLSGISGLIYQVAWVREATLVFGVSVYAYSAVLAAFMGGAALGSYLLRKRVDKAGQPLRFFCGLQLGIAVFGALSPFLLVGLMPVYGNIARGLPVDSWLITAVRVAFSAAILIPPTFLMGATLPAMSRAYARRQGQVGSDVGLLYASDTLGAALGAGLSGLVLLRTLGTRETIFLAVAFNLLAALGAWLLARRTQDPVETNPAASPAKPIRRGRQVEDLPGVQTRSAHFVLWAYALSGFAALGYEVAWARILAIFTLDAVFSFSIMLTTFLTGLTIGGAVGAWWVRKRRVTLVHFGALEMAVALSALSTLFIFARLPRLQLESVFGVYSVANVVYFEFLLGFLSLFVPTVLLGVLFPIVISIYTRERRDSLGANVGLVYALNTAGAIFGSLLTGFLLVPIFGLQMTVIVLALLNLAIGAAAFWLAKGTGTRWWLTPAIAGAAALLMLVFVPDGHYLGFREGPGDYMVFYGEGVESTVAVFNIPHENFKVSFVNGRIEVPTDEISMRAFRLLGHLPPILKPDAERALMLSFGNGIATGSLATHGISHIEAVDLAAEQFEAAEIYWEENHNVLHSPSLQTHVEDGRNFLLQTPYEYDIITTDATHPSNTSSWALFTREFYESVDDQLADDGIFMQWIPFHSLLEEDYRSILRTFQSVFPHATLWYTGGSHTLLLATPETVTDEWLAQRLAAAQENQIVTDDIGPASQLDLFLAMDEDELSAYTGEGKLVVDNNAYFLPHADETEQILAAMQERVSQ